MSSVRKLMTEGVISCRSDANLATVAATLARHRVHAVFVTDAAGLPAGVLSDFDLLTGEWLGSAPEGLRAMQSVTAGELMSSPVQTIGVEETLSAAASRMRELHLSRLLVLDDQGAVGVISVSDLVAPLGRPSGARQTVSDVMSHAIVTCPPDTSLQAAARAMTERCCRSIVVVDEHGRAVGVITGNDLLVLYGPGEPAATVTDLMTPPITCEADLPLAAAADLIISNEVHRLVVIDASQDSGVPIGVVSTADIVAEMASGRSVWQRGSA
jgi:CBS domain-containing protein